MKCKTGVLWYCGKRDLQAEILRVLRRSAARLGVAVNCCDVAQNLPLPNEPEGIKFEHSRSIPPGYVLVYHRGEDLL